MVSESDTYTGLATIQLSISEKQTKTNKEIHVRTYVFVKKVAVAPIGAAATAKIIVGIMVCNDFMALTPRQTAKINSKGIEVIEKKAEYAHHDGDMNRLVDLLCENEKLGQ
jgi:hypothetical protein